MQGGVKVNKEGGRAVVEGRSLKIRMCDGCGTWTEEIKKGKDAKLKVEDGRVGQTREHKDKMDPTEEENRKENISKQVYFPHQRSGNQRYTGHRQSPHS